MVKVEADVVGCKLFEAGTHVVAWHFEEVG